MVHSPTDDLFSSQQWEHWAMVFILVLGLVVGYGQAAAEDRRRAQRRRGKTTIGAVQNRRRRSRRRSGPEQMQVIAPKPQRNQSGATAPVNQPPLRPLSNTRLPNRSAIASPLNSSNSPL